MWKLTIGFVRNEFEKEGYVLLSKKYVNSKTKLECKCPKGHIYLVSWSSWKSGCRCIHCSNQVKPTIKFIRAEFEKEGYILLSKRYVNNRTKLHYICPNGHKHSVSWKGWQKNGNRCPYCSKKIKKTIVEIRKSFNDRGYTLLSKSYKNAFCKLKYKCPNGHVHSITWVHWSNGHGCPYCAGQIKPTIDEIRKSFNSEGYLLHSTTYSDNKTKLKYTCPKGHMHYISWLKWKQGRRCRECSYYKRGINASGENSPNWKGGISCEPYCQDWTKEFKEFIKERDGYKCLNPDCWKKDPMLTVHHIDYDKKNCRPDNLITVCRSCNIRANIDRGWHTAWYRAIMYRRYKYIY